MAIFLVTLTNGPATVAHHVDASDEAMALGQALDTVDNPDDWSATIVDGLVSIQSAVRAGRTVYWKNPRYTVTLSIGRRTGAEQWLICCDTGDCVGLTHRDGFTMSEKISDFYLA